MPQSRFSKLSLDDVQVFFDSDDAFKAWVAIHSQVAKSVIGEETTYTAQRLGDVQVSPEPSPH
jgi:hypothetical protein